ncbi:MAG: HD domain-containing protein [Planctomycetes bacterium]|nr:HD domain-containing protein [Planctomycetota bacterium]
MAHIFVKDITAGKQIDDVYMVHDPILRSTTNGGLYIAMYLSDKTGQLNGRMWQATESAYNSLPKPGFIKVQGRSELYKDNLQIIVNQFQVVDSEQVQIADFLARTEKNRKEMFEEIIAMLAQIKNPQIGILVGAFIEDKELMKKFCQAPAAVKMHHNYIGGLLEHTHNMMKVANAILPLYPKINSDLVLAAIFIHDMGKTDELSYDMAFSYTDSGQLIGHISKGIMMLQKKADKLADSGKTVDEDVLDVLGHIILAHHGQYEFGSPKLPATAEAFMVNYIDDLDAKMSQVTSAINDEPGDSNWTGWQGSLGTRLYRKAIGDL